MEKVDKLVKKLKKCYRKRRNLPRKEAEKDGVEREGAAFQRRC